MMWLTAVGLCAAGLAAIIVEFFVPAAGIVGLLGFGSIVGGIVVAYSNYGPVVGSIYLITMVIITPAIIAIYFKIFPKSFVGKWLILGGVAQSGKLTGTTSDSRGEDKISEQDELVGRTGTTVSMLRPSGTVRIEGKRYSVVTGGEFVDRGEVVVVTRVAGNRIHVRKGAHAG